MRLFQPVADVREQLCAITDRALVSFGQPYLNFDEFRLHDPDLQFDSLNHVLQRSGTVGFCCIQFFVGGYV